MIDIITCPTCLGKGNVEVSTDSDSEITRPCYTCECKGIVIAYINPNNNRYEYIKINS